jgi:hypothetical protein
MVHAPYQSTGKHSAMGVPCADYARFRRCGITILNHCFLNDNTNLSRCKYRNIMEIEEIQITAEGPVDQLHAQAFKETLTKSGRSRVADSAMPRGHATAHTVTKQRFRRLFFRALASDKVEPERY